MNVATLSSVLSAATVENFKATGWAGIPEFFSAAEIDRISAWTDELEHRPEVVGEHWVYRQPSLLDPTRKVIQRIENFCPFHAGFDDLARRSRLTAAVGQLLGGPALLFKEKINLKEPGGEGFKLHQDQQAGWGRYAPLFITVMICIDPATPENGCLKMASAPGRLDRLIGEEWKPIDEEEAGLAMHSLPMAPGDIAFFDSFIPHSSEENLSANRRRAVFFTYNNACHGDVRQQYHDDKRANCPPDVERAPGSEYEFRV